MFLIYFVEPTIFELTLFLILTALACTVKFDEYVKDSRYFGCGWCLVVANCSRQIIDVTLISQIIQLHYRLAFDVIREQVDPEDNIKYIGLIGQNVLCLMFFVFRIIQNMLHYFQFFFLFSNICITNDHFITIYLIVIGHIVEFHICCREMFKT